MAACLLTALGAGLIVLVGATTDLFGRAPPPPPVVTADAADVAVIDGATLRIRDRVLRLRGIAAPERGAACGVAGSPDCGGAAAAQLAAFLRDRPVECRLDGRDDHGRPWAACAAGGRDLSAAMVRAGWARAADEALRDAEAEAQRRRNGVWAGRL